MKPAIDTHIRPEVRDVLGTLKSKIRLYVCVEGLALVLVVLEILFWLSFSINWLWFLATKFELAEWFRVGFDMFAIGVLLTAVSYWIGMRIFRSMQSKPLALVLERRFPDLNDRLITSVELKKSITGDESPLTVSMLNRTVEAARQEAGRIRVSEVFDIAPVRWAVIGAVIAMISIAGYGIVDGADMNRWVKAYIGLEAEYWERDTHLNLQVVASPNERVREFAEEEDEDGNPIFVYKHPTGGDLTLLVTVPRGNNSKGNPYVIPDQVDVEHRTFADDKIGSKKTRTCTKTGDRTFRLSFGSVTNNMIVWVVGNDFKNRIPYHVRLVDPPEAQDIELDCIYPGYTGKDPERITVLGKDLANPLPMETRFLFQVNTSKPLYDVGVDFGRYHLEFGEMPISVKTDYDTGRVTYERRFRANLVTKGLDKVEAAALAAVVGPNFGDDIKNTEFTFPIPEEYARRFFKEDKKGFRIPFIVSSRKTNAARERFEQKRKGSGEYFAIVTEDGTQIDLGMPLVMEPGVDVRIYLEDTDQIGSTDPGKVTINVKEDEPPVIEASRQGIGVAITWEASIPIAAMINDDYGIADAFFQYRIAPGENAPPGDWKERDFDNKPDGNSPSRLFVLQRTAVDGTVEKFERFEANLVRVPDEESKNKKAPEFRDLQPGDILTIAVVARDGDNLNGPHETRSVPEFAFRIVSAAEMFIILGKKESDLRKKFEKIIDEVQKLRDEIQDRQTLLGQMTSLRQQKTDPAKAAEVRQQILDLGKRIKLTASRASALIVETHNESKQVQAGFEGIRAELINNKLFTKEQAKQTKSEVIDDLVKINDTKLPDGHYRLAIKAIGEYNTKVNADGPEAPISEDPKDELADAYYRTSVLIVAMQAALDKMEKGALIGDLIKSLFLMRQDQNVLKRDTVELRKKQQQKILDDLKKKLQGTKKP